MLKTKDGYKLELLTPEGIEFFGSTKKLIDETNNEKTYQFLKKLK